MSVEIGNNKDSRITTQKALKLSIEVGGENIHKISDMVQATSALSVGQRVTCIAKSNVPILAVKWTIQGSTVESYTLSTGPSYPNFLTQYDLSQIQVSFNWVAGGTYNVSAYIVTSSGSGTAAHSFVVTAPTVALFASDTGSVNLTTYKEMPAIAFLDEFGDKRGISFNINIRGDQNINGIVCGIQLVNTGRTDSLTAGGGEYFSSNGHWVVDNGWTPDTFIYQAPQVLNAGGTAGLPLVDGPLQGLGDAIRVMNINDEFRMYIMFKPDGNSSVWVPLQMCAWYWKGTATRTGVHNWDLTNASNAQNPVGGAVETLPSWMNNVASALWIKTPDNNQPID